MDQVQVLLHFLSRSRAAFQNVVGIQGLLLEQDLSLKVSAYLFPFHHAGRCILVNTWQVILSTELAVASLSFYDRIPLSNVLAVVARAWVAAVSRLLLKDRLQLDLGKQVGVVVLEVGAGNRAVENRLRLLAMVCVATEVVHTLNC